MLKTLLQYVGFSKPIDTDLKRVATDANYKINSGNRELEARQRIKIAEKFAEAADIGSNEITFSMYIHPFVERDLLTVGYTIRDGKCDDYRNVGGNVEFREIPCKIIKLPPNST
jgi:hypothetical protein